MKILIATGIFPPEIGGPATYAAELATKLVQQGHIVKVVTYSNTKTDVLDEEYPFSIDRIVRYGKGSNYFRFFWYFLFKMKKYDIVYSLDWFSVGGPLWLASGFNSKKYIVRVGGGYIWEKYLAQGKPPITMREFYEKELYRDYPFMYWLIRNVLLGASTVIFNSNVQAELYTDHYGLRQGMLRVIYNPTSAPKIAVTRTAPNKQIIFAGRFIVMKNVESLIRAFAMMKDTSYTLVLIGEGPREKALRKLITELGLDERVLWSPSLPRSELYSQIIDCAYVVIPSWTDISPNQAYECLALGIPFLITKENYLAIRMQEFLTIDPKSVDDIAHAMDQLSDPVEYQKLCDDLKRITFSYSWDEAVKDHMTIFNEVLRPQRT